MTDSAVPDAAARLCLSCIIVFASSLALLCAAFSILIHRDTLFPPPPGKDRFPRIAVNVMLSILSVVGLSLMVNRLPSFLSFF